MSQWTRREILAAGVAGLVGCVASRESAPGQPDALNEGAPPVAEPCPSTAPTVEGPYYLEGAPERSHLDRYEDAGTPLSLSGTVFDGDCETPMAGAVIDFWHANPEGAYDNASDEMRYRGRVTTDEDGAYALETLLPGRYNTGTRVRPRHIHVQVFDSTGAHRLTTQLYFEGDPFLEGDNHADPSLVLPFTGSEDTAMVAGDAHIVLTPDDT
jgi:protocatechuate 3,4-dioxygenase beta subunit